MAVEGRLSSLGTLEKKSEMERFGLDGLFERPQTDQRGKHTPKRELRPSISEEVKKHILEYHASQPILTATATKQNLQDWSFYTEQKCETDHGEVLH